MLVQFPTPLTPRNQPCKLWLLYSRPAWGDTGISVSGPTGPHGLRPSSPAPHQEAKSSAFGVPECLLPTTSEP